MFLGWKKKTGIENIIDLQIIKNYSKNLWSLESVEYMIDWPNIDDYHVILIGIPYIDNFKVMRVPSQETTDHRSDCIFFIRYCFRKK